MKVRFLGLVAVPLLVIVLGAGASPVATLERSSPEKQAISSAAILAFLEAAEAKVRRALALAGNASERRFLGRRLREVG